MTYIVHPIPPVFNKESEILILGSFPSVKSREAAFFYAHPRNRLWQTLAAIYASSVPREIDEKKDFLLSRHIALWDVVAECEINASADSSIRNVKPNDLSKILENAPIQRIFTNGSTAHKLYIKYIQPICGRQACALPSTSPANARYSLAMLVEAWKVIQDV